MLMNIPIISRIGIRRYTRRWKERQEKAKWDYGVMLANNRYK